MYGQVLMSMLGIWIRADPYLYSCFSYFINIFDLFSATNQMLPSHWRYSSPWSWCRIFALTNLNLLKTSVGLKVFWLGHILIPVILCSWIKNQCYSDSRKSNATRMSDLFAFIWEGWYYGDHLVLNHCHLRCAKLKVSRLPQTPSETSRTKAAASIT